MNHSAIIKFVTLIVFQSAFVLGQESTPPPPARTPFRERIFTGGNIGLQFGNVTYIDVSPRVGYKLTEKAAAGIGATYIYINDKRYKSIGYEYSTDIYGGRVFAQYQLLENILAYSEFEVLNAEVFDDITYKFSRQNIPSFLAGGGYTSPIGAHSSFVILALWNLLESRYSIYQNPIIRVGFNIGL